MSSFGLGRRSITGPVPSATAPAVECAGEGGPGLRRADACRPLGAPSARTRPRSVDFPSPGGALGPRYADRPSRIRDGRGGPPAQTPRAETRLGAGLGDGRSNARSGELSNVVTTV